MKQNKKAKNCAVFCFAGKRFFFYIYDVITWEKLYKRFRLYYSHIHTHTHKYLVPVLGGRVQGHDSQLVAQLAQHVPTRYRHPLVRFRV